ncbi:hypothetical protein IFM89_038870 [Coptis chinensis]|uniref:Vacuolar protein 8 n=1 Tax=Coptis chinensis TaxID=261450 RepID=A0A835I666_9MAGN|nr:hypothetical protein IFM89_038870 [Coptis chinensis]
MLLHDLTSLLRDGKIGKWFLYPSWPCIIVLSDKNQEKIVEEGGLKALLMLLGISKSATIHQVASGAIANLAMNETNQVLIVSKGGAQLLADIASRTDDPPTLRAVAEAIANLCGNRLSTNWIQAKPVQSPEKLHVMLKEDGVIKVLMKMVLSGYADVIAEVARGLANFAKYEFRARSHGQRKGPSLLLEDGALTWLISNSTTTSASTRHHIELALCHLAENDENTQDFISSGALKELARISCGSSKEDVRDSAKKTLKLNPRFRFWMQTNAD